MIWSYLNLDGVRTDINTTTNSTTGVSIIQVYTTHPGYYTCEVSQNGGINTTSYTVEIENKSKYLQTTNTQIYTIYVLRYSEI